MPDWRDPYHPAPLSMETGDDFSVEVQRRDRVVVVAPAGEIDVATVERLRRPLHAAEEGAASVVLDLRRVGFMDTSGLQLVFEEQRRSSQSTFEFVIVRGSRQLQRLFDIAGFGDRLRMVDDPADVV